MASVPPLFPAQTPPHGPLVWPLAPRLSLPSTPSPSGICLRICPAPRAPAWHCPAVQGETHPLCRLPPHRGLRRRQRAPLRPGLPLGGGSSGSGPQRTPHPWAALTPLPDAQTQRACLLPPSLPTFSYCHCLYNRSGTSLGFYDRRGGVFG